MNITLYTPEQQGTGQFDGGRLVEQKPIGFPHERTAVKRVGPLFYWSWFYAKERAYIPLHPHQGFEIMTYLLEGEAVHGDTLGTRSTIKTGGAQVMATGWGVEHEEEFMTTGTEGFQIWFEPYLNEAVKKQPTYHQYEHEEFPRIGSPSETGLVKTIIGEGSPIHLTADVQVWEAAIDAGHTYRHSILEGYSVAVLALRGAGCLKDASGQETLFHEKDFMVCQAVAAETLTIQASSQALRILLITAPTTVDYPLYRK